MWEAKNLPHYGKEVGYMLFLKLSCNNIVTTDALKEFYLQMPYAESTVRLLLRNLEADGWIYTPRNQYDKRARQFVLTERFISKRDEWLKKVHETLVSTQLIDKEKS